MCGPSRQPEFVSRFFVDMAIPWKKIQIVGETSLAALLLVSFIQGALIRHQYFTNPQGELAIPRGCTKGVEDASSRPTTTTTMSREGPRGMDSDQPSLPTPLSMATHPPLREDIKASNHNAVVHLAGAFEKGWYRLIAFLPLLLLWIAAESSFLLVRLQHLTHLAVILTLVHVFDFFRPLPELSGVDSASHQPNIFRDHLNVMVIGDSMAIGIGCVNQYDKEKDSSVLRRVEQLESTESIHNDEGPVFPRILALTLSERLGKPVAWRSAGVDGGDTKEIRDYLLPVIQEEVDLGNEPDLVVVITGSNDMKRILNPKDSATVRGFRSNLLELVKEIRTLSPRTKVVFPALPTYTLDPNSILNVFPLTFFLDMLIGFWDSQKVRVANQCHNVYYVHLSTKDVNEWYMTDSDGHHRPRRRPLEETPVTLFAADGIHPNALCYSKWARHVGNRLSDTLLSAIGSNADADTDAHSPPGPVVAPSSRKAEHQDLSQKR